MRTGRKTGRAILPPTPSSIARGLLWLANHGRAELDSDETNPPKKQRRDAENAIEWVNRFAYDLLAKGRAR